jgi:predicted RNase H-like nuclease (RuvC/YqgF family)
MQHFRDEPLRELRAQIDDTIEDLACSIQKLTASLDEQMSYLKNRHRLLAELERLEADYSVPFKQLERRLALLTEIRRLSVGTELAELSTDQLKQRIEYIETIRRLEPEGQRVSIKSLRERARLLERVEPAPTEVHADEDFFGEVSH